MDDLASLAEVEMSNLSIILMVLAIWIGLSVLVTALYIGPGGRR